MNVMRKGFVREDDGNGGRCGEVSVGVGRWVWVVGRWVWV